MFTYNQTVPAVSAGAGVTRKVLSHSDTLMVCEITLEAGSVIASHAHPHEQITYIISGKCRYTVGEATAEVAAGDSVLIPGSVPHSIQVLETMKVIDAFSPAREDFL
ncbi:MAG: cupin domain-containing protein [Oscillospiraceae bacterium]|nr:cupin domain-containing protein [Oscillospiraceae bacterium]